MGSLFIDLVLSVSVEQIWNGQRAWRNNPFLLMRSVFLITLPSWLFENGIDILYFSQWVWRVLKYLYVFHEQCNVFWHTANMHFLALSNIFYSIKVLLLLLHVLLYRLQQRLLWKLRRRRETGRRLSWWPLQRQEPKEELRKVLQHQQSLLQVGNSVLHLYPPYLHLIEILFPNLMFPVVLLPPKSRKLVTMWYDLCVTKILLLIPKSVKCSLELILEV